MQAGIRVLLISNQRILREAIAALLKAEAEIGKIGIISNISGRWYEALDTAYDVALVNLWLDPDQTLHLIQALKSHSPRLKILLWGIHQDDHESILKFIEAGVSGYISREASFDELVDGIKNVYVNCTRCTPHIIARVIKRISHLASERSEPEKGLNVRLTAREQVILELIAQGFANKQIAQHLNISPFTVKNHVHNILDKMKVRYRGIAIRRAYEIGLLNQSIQSRSATHWD